MQLLGGSGRWRGSYPSGRARPAQLAVRALQNLKEEIVLRETGRVKNRYITRLGGAACICSLLSVIIWGIAYVLDWRMLEFQPHNWSQAWQTFALLGTGCMFEVWISFGARKTIFRFEDLAAPEADAMEPCVRLLFAGIIAMGAAFYMRIIEIYIGTFSTAQLEYPPDPLLAE